MLTKEEFVFRVLTDASTPLVDVTETEGSILDGFDGFDDEVHPPETTSPELARDLLTSCFGNGPAVPVDQVLLPSDEAERRKLETLYHPGAYYWRKTAERPFHVVLLRLIVDAQSVLRTSPRRTIRELGLIEDELQRQVADGLMWFARGGVRRTSDMPQGSPEETLFVVTASDEREVDATTRVSREIVCFGTSCVTTQGFESFTLYESSRDWDPSSLAREHFETFYIRHMEPLGKGARWQDAFVTGEHRKRAEKLLQCCEAEVPRSEDIVSASKDLLRELGGTYGHKRTQLVFEKLRGDHFIAADPAAVGTSGFHNEFEGLVVRDHKTRVLGYVVYCLDSRNSAPALRAQLRKHNAFDNVLMIYPDGQDAAFELWQGSERLDGRLTRQNAQFRGVGKVLNLLSRFFLVSQAPVKNAKDLAEQLAKRAQYLKGLALRQLAAEDETGHLRGIFEAFKKGLVSDLDKEGFADAFAQTVSNGLLTARWASRSASRRGAPFTVTEALKAIPATNPFLRGFFKGLDEIRQQPSGGLYLWMIDDIASLLERVDVRHVFDFNPDDEAQGKDPVIHFFEDFLAAYDKKQKVQRGVFYTPRPVVSYIVRSVDEILRTEFGLEDGLADTTTWGEMVARNTGLSLPLVKARDQDKQDSKDEFLSPNQAFVQVLDPATGTGTFLVEVINVVHGTMMARWSALPEAERIGRWQRYVAGEGEWKDRGLLQRLHGYELLMAPYAIAHLKIGLKLHETGYRFGSDQRAQVYLTNALEPAHDGQVKIEGVLPALANEANTVNEVKQKQRFTAVIGNPPYSIRSGNLSDGARCLVEPFKFVDGQRIVEKGALQLEKNLNDDYVKFLGLIRQMLERQSAGVVGVITNHAFLDNPTFRGFRWNLLSTVARLRFLDLHGNSKKKEQVPAGFSNENVFDIQQGVGISLLVRRPSAKQMAIVELAELWGSREEKYRSLFTGKFEFRAIECPSPWFRIGFMDANRSAEFDSYTSLTEAFPVTTTGIKTHRDAFVIDFDEQDLRDRVAMFRSNTSDSVIAEKFGLEDTYGWKLTEARRRIRLRIDWQDAFQRLLYRPFDYRHIYYHADLVELPRYDCMRHLDGGRNLALLTTRQVTSPPFTHVLVTRLVSEMKTCSHDRGTNCFPLYLLDEGNDLYSHRDRRRLNFSAAFLRALFSTFSESRAQASGLPCGITPEDVFHYVYGVLYSPSYRERYSKFLQTEFPRIPRPANPGLFHDLARIGNELVSIHLLESPRTRPEMAVPFGARNAKVGQIGWASDTVWIDGVNKRGQITTVGTMGFRGVPEAVWSFDIGGYQVCHKWLKDRKGRTLTDDDITHYQKIIVALAETIRLMQEIDEVIEAHGGWPGAFKGKDDGEIGGEE